MLDSQEVIGKLKKMLGYKTDLELAQLLDIKPNTLSSWKIRKTMRYDKIIEVGKRFKIDLNSLFFKEPYYEEEDKIGENRVKMISVEKHMEYFLNKDICLEQSPAGVFTIDKEIDVAFQIAMDNMFPTLRVGGYALCKSVKIQDLKPWHLYLLVIKDKGIFCYRYKGIDHQGNYMFLSDIARYECPTISSNDIREIFLIQGMFASNLNAF